MFNIVTMNSMLKKKNLTGPKMSVTVESDLKIFLWNFYKICNTLYQVFQFLFWYFYNQDVS